MTSSDATIDSGKTNPKIHSSVGVESSRMSVCASCTRIYGPWLDGAETRVQRCDCGRKQFAEEPKWPRFDFNEVVELCRCCGQELLRSGSRWSVWFCEPCKARVVAFNTMCRRAIIPIGRHSLMAGIGLSSSAISDQSKLESNIKDFVVAARGLFKSQNHLSVWRNRQVSAKLRLLGANTDVLLASYLCGLRRLAVEGVEALDKAKIFEGLREFFIR
jgi:hypothetical protein